MPVCPRGPICCPRPRRRVTPRKVSSVTRSSTPVRSTQTLLIGRAVSPRPGGASGVQEPGSRISQHGSRGGLSLTLGRNPQGLSPLAERTRPRRGSAS